MSALQLRLLLATARAVRLLLAADAGNRWPRRADTDPALAELVAALTVMEEREGR